MPAPLKVTLLPTKRSGCEFDVIANNGVVLGKAHRDIDGYIYFESTPPHGYWNAYTLRLVADALDDANREWDDRVRAAMGEGARR